MTDAAIAHRAVGERRRSEGWTASVLIGPATLFRKLKEYRLPA